MKLHTESQEEKQLRLQNEFGSYPTETIVSLLDYAGLCLDLPDALTASTALARKAGLLEPDSPTIAERSSGRFAVLFDQMRNAHLKGLAWPKILLGGELQLTLTYNAKRDIINITNGKSYGHPDNLWFGRIEDKITWDGSISWNDRVMHPPVKASAGNMLQQYMRNPAEYALQHSKHTNRCMFCAKELQKAESRAVGYGPTCADKYGLPWGEK